MLFRREPPTLVRAIEAPRPTRVVITQARLSTVREQGVEHLELEGTAEAQALVGSLLALLRGDGEVLGSSYKLEYTARWRSLDPPSHPPRSAPRSSRSCVDLRRGGRSRSGAGGRRGERRSHRHSRLRPGLARRFGYL